MQGVPTIAAVIALAAPGAVLAQEAPAWSFSGWAGVTSDYRDRGISLSGEEIALQGEVTATHRSGFYGDLWASQIEEYGVGTDGDGAEVELAWTVGWAGSRWGLDWDLGAAFNQYPDGDGVSYWEFPVQVGRTEGPWTWTVGAYYAPAQANLGDEDDAYVWGALNYAPAHWPISLNAGVGYEDGYFAPGGNGNWSVGASLPLGPLTASLTWTESEFEDATLVASLIASF